MSLVVWDYRTADGAFDYDAYVSAQTRRNAERQDRTWVHRTTVKELARYIRQTTPSPTFALCHGTRRGDEQRWFREEFPGCEVIGTEIAPTATNYPHTIQWDFHETKPEWLGACDFIYSNSMDHAYSPEKALLAWVSCLKPDGMCLVDWVCSSGDAPTRKDPFSATLPAFAAFVNDVGGATFGVTDVFQTPMNKRAVFKKPGGRKTRVATLVIRRSPGQTFVVPAAWASSSLPRMALEAV